MLVRRRSQTGSLKASKILGSSSIKMHPNDRGYCLPFVSITHNYKYNDKANTLCCKHCFLIRSFI